MTNTNFNLRNIDSKIMILLKKEAKLHHISVNSLILKLIEKNLGLSHQMKSSTYHDLDHLAGTWSKGDAKEFEENTPFFEKIDKDLWS